MPVRIAMTSQMPYPSRSANTSSNIWLSTLVTDTDMVHEQAHRRMSFELAAVAENGGDDNGDNANAGPHTKRGRADEVGESV
jgi:hypothetical protein